MKKTIDFTLNTIALEKSEKCSTQLAKPPEKQFKQLQKPKSFLNKPKHLQCLKTHLKPQNSQIHTFTTLQKPHFFHLKPQNSASTNPKTKEFVFLRLYMISRNKNQFSYPPNLGGALNSYSNLF
jgi:hypothetical protein